LSFFITAEMPECHSMSFVLFRVHH